MSTLLDTDDAMVWAEEFCRIFQGRLIITKDKPYGIGPGVDEGTMLTWFANAIETAKRIEGERYEAVLRQLSERYIEATNPGIDMDRVRELREGYHPHETPWGQEHAPGPGEPGDASDAT